MLLGFMEFNTISQVLKFLRINIFKLIKRLFDINMGWNTIWCKGNIGGLVTPFMKNKP